MIVLRRPGSMIPIHLPSEAGKRKEDRAVLWVTILTQALWNEIEDYSRQELGNFELSRRVIGRIVDRIENVKTEDGKTFELVKDEAGHLTRDCAEFLLPYHNEIVALCMATGRLEPADRKNFSSP